MPLPQGPVVGTCGFGYQEWRGRFYPPELAATEWLGFYARVFEAVELDGTFYRPPERSVVAAWAAALPEKFALSAKVPRAITHEAALRRRLRQPTPDPRSLWPEPPLPGFEL